MKIFSKYALCAVFCAMGIGMTSALCAEQYVRPCGETVGIKLYTDGLLVVGVSDVEDSSGNKLPAAKSSGIRVGDILLSANGQPLERTEELAEITENSEGAVSVTVKRKNKTESFSVNPARTADGLRLGLWVRDSTAGIGTVTYLSQDGKSYAALGHGITDVDTGNILSLKCGNILNCSEISVRKSQKGDIGALSCSFNQNNIGNILMNTANGIYGAVEDGQTAAQPEMRVAAVDEIQEGDAVILCDVDGCGVREYGIEIKKVSKMSAADKTLVFEITDDALIAKTGGIVQGMSGSPILQNGLFIGAVTHVFINDPIRGFGVAGESMIEHTNDLSVPQA